MELTRQSVYAIRCVLETARHERISTAELARRQHIPVGFLSKIVGSLARAGILETRRGAGGGVRLGRPPGAITVLDVIEAAQGPIRLRLCIGPPAVCDRAGNCTVTRICGDAQEAVTAAFSVTFATLCADLERTARERPGHPAASDLVALAVLGGVGHGEPFAMSDGFGEPAVAANGRPGGGPR